MVSGRDKTGAALRNADAGKSTKIMGDKPVPGFFTAAASD
jgi:hypothetical protein